MRSARIERDDDSLMLQIDEHIFHASNSFEHGSKFTHTFIAIFAFGGDLDRLQDCVIGALRIKRVGWIGFVWSCGVHLFLLVFNKRSTPAQRSSCALCHVEQSETSSAIALVNA